MSISFQLNLTPSQIEFLQNLDLYADGLRDFSAAFYATPGATHMGICWVRKLIREGLVEHVPEDDKHRYDSGLRSIGDERIVIPAYRITDKGRAVLNLIEQDVKAFLERQKSYQTAKKNNRKQRA